MNAISEFLNMSGDGVFVWPCYAMTLIVLIANIIFTRSKFKRLTVLAKRRGRVT